MVARVRLDGNSLTIEQLARIARDPNSQVTCAPDAMSRVRDAAALVREAVDRYTNGVRADDPNTVLEYGVTTGFGEFKRIPINPARLSELQVNILLSHAAGVGENLDGDDLSNYYPAEVVRAVFALRINAFLKGHSGIRPDVVLVVEELLNRDVIPLVPLKGSVGSSGDLAPLAHLFVVLCESGREGSRFYQQNDRVGGHLRIRSAKDLPGLLGITMPEPTAKEGLALTNGASFSAAMLALAVYDAGELANVADVAAAMSAEALLGCARAFDDKVHIARQQLGQRESARLLRTALSGSKLLETHAEVQDPYSIRCAPAVHGASRDAIDFARAVVAREINAATDNPLFFGHDGSWDAEFEGNWARRTEDRLRKPSAEAAYDGTKRRSYSAGNFHGQPCALAADMLAIALAEFANISERRTQLLMDGDHNRGLPGNLVPDAGLNSGFMIAQYCAAALVSENKVLAHPASVDSIPTSSNSEDHNSMATIAARKLRTVLANVRHVLAIELLVATQALEWATLFDGIKSGTLPIEFASAATDYMALRDKNESAYQPSEPPGDRKNETPVERRNRLWKRGQLEHRLFKEWTLPANRPWIRARLGGGTGAAFLAVRSQIEPMLQDRMLAEDIRRAALLIAPTPDGRSLISDAGIGDRSDAQ